VMETTCVYCVLIDCNDWKEDKLIYSEEIIEEVRIRNDITSVISGYVHLARQGRRMVGLCPFHSEKTPSFSVDTTKQMFYCFGCNKGGNVFHFLMNIENLDFPDALKQLADRAGIILPESEDKGERERSSLKKEIQALNREAARFFYQQLAGEKGKVAQQYLIRRGLPEKMIRTFGIGYAPDSRQSLMHFLLGKGASMLILEKAGLISVSHYEYDVPEQSGQTTASNGFDDAYTQSKQHHAIDKFRNRIMFPIFDIRGNIVAFGGRVLDNGIPKYLNSPETLLFSKSKELYGMNFARLSKSKQIVVVEGYMDVISLHAVGIDSTVATLGTSLTQQHAWILKKYAEEVILAYDADTAGQNATERGIEILEKAGCIVRILQISDGKDPDDYVRKHGKESFKVLMNNAMTLLEYRLYLQHKKHPGLDVDDRVQMLNGMADVLSEHENAIEREMILSKLAGEYKVSVESLKEEVGKRIRKQNRNIDVTRSSGILRKQSTHFGATSWNKYDESELLLLSILCNENRLFEDVSIRMPVHSYKGNLSKTVAASFYQRMLRNNEASLAELVNDLTAETASAIIHLSETKGTIDAPGKAVDGLLKRIERMALEDEKKWILDSLKTIDNDDKKKELSLELKRVIARMSDL